MENLIIKIIIRKFITHTQSSIEHESEAQKTHTKLYQNQPRFVKDMTKRFWCLFSSQV